MKDKSQSKKYVLSWSSQQRLLVWSEEGVRSKSLERCHKTAKTFLLVWFKGTISEATEKLELPHFSSCAAVFQSIPMKRIISTPKRGAAVVTRTSPERHPNVTRTSPERHNKSPDVKQKWTSERLPVVLHKHENQQWNNGRGYRSTLDLHSLISSWTESSKWFCQI